LMEVSFGLGAGSFEGKGNDSGGGGVGAKMSPSAVLILNNGTSKLISVKDTSGVAKVLDLVPDFVNKFMDGGSTEKEEDLDDIFADEKEEISEVITEVKSEENKE
ncbi:MAG: GerW family sporulation protein, partial [Lachnospiraceae bacterium]|nr:GerW family sporulation protein [Lachnospiraceae bacterium]